MLHVLNGDATRVKLEQSRVPGVFAVWADVLHEGPTPLHATQESWRETRARYLAQAGYTSYDEALGTLRAWDRRLESYREHDEVVLWFEHDLFDQLLLIRHLDWFDTQELGSTVLSLICIDRFPGVPEFAGLGQLTPDQLALLLESRQRVTSEQMALGRHAWEAFCAPTPEPLEALLTAGTSPLPLLAGALRRHLEEYPHVSHGLSRSERQILAAIAAGAESPVKIFERAQRMEERVFAGDATVWHQVRELAAGSHPLLRLNVDGPAGTLPSGTVSLTEDGRRVLEGVEDRIALNGIDRWLGGVHLTTESLWRWDGTGIVREHKQSADVRRPPV
jgi:hypothetical protein